MNTPFYGPLRTVLREARRAPVNTTRKKGLTRHKNPLTTLKHETQPSSERFLPFLPHYVDSDDPKTLKCYRATRQVVRDRVQFGKVILAVGTGHWNAGDGELRLCPYFEPKSKTLKFQQLDGTDYPEVRELPTLLSSPCYRPTLLLAHDEELLDSVPAGELSSLDFQTVLQSGYIFRARFYAEAPGTTGRYWTNFHFAGETAARRWCFAPAKDEVREYIDCFPYIDAEDRLRIWDVENSRDLRVATYAAYSVPSSLAPKASDSKDKGQQRRVVTDSFSAEDVKRRCRSLFGMIQRKGYWKDV